MYYQNAPTFIGVYSRKTLSKIKYGTYIINFDEQESIQTYWTALYVNGNNNSIYVVSFGAEHIAKEIRKFNGNKNITINI